MTGLPGDPIADIMPVTDTFSSSLIKWKSVGPNVTYNIAVADKVFR